MTAQHIALAATPADRRIAELEDALAALIDRPTINAADLFPDSRRLPPAVNTGSTTEETP